MITLQELADENHFSPNYLSRLIRENTGKTFHELSSCYWTEKAKTLLQCTPFTIDEISELMGISSRANFERKFKTLVCMSPAQYRQQFSAEFK
jgi:two-component system response regulator YesN